MKQFLVFSLFLLHLNVALIPHFNETDKFSSTGIQLEDVNSFIELIRVNLGYDKTADDEDDDTEDSGQIIVVADYIYPKISLEINSISLFVLNMQNNSKFSLENLKLQSTFYDIDAPPPKA